MLPTVIGRAAARVRRLHQHNTLPIACTGLLAGNGTHSPASAAPPPASAPNGYLRFATRGHDGSGSIEGAYTPVTKALWAERLRLAAAAAADADANGGGAPGSAPQQAARKTEPRGARRTTVQYPFSTDRVLAELYRNPWGFVRMGKILEDLDSMAANVAFFHCHDETPGAPPPPALVTASVDAIEVRHRIAIAEDATMSGQVVWTGTSSLDVRMELKQVSRGDEPSLVALFSFVALDPATSKPVAISPLQPAGGWETEQFQERQAVADARRAARKAGAPAAATATPARAAPDAAAAARLQAAKLLDLPSLAPSDAVLMRSTLLQNAFVCQPQHRNTRGRVFGGFLMRRAFELAFSTAYMHCGSRPSFERVDDITFRKPVEVGDLLRLKSLVLHTEVEVDKGRMVVEVTASVTQPEKVTSFVSNRFIFLFSVAQVPGTGAPPLKRTLPENEEQEERLRAYLASV